MTAFDYQAAAQERKRRAKVLRDAAPDLLAALEDIVSASAANCGDSLANAIQEGIAAIAKARGV